MSSRPAHRRYRFPVIELIHGFPGAPQDWITVLGVDVMLRSLIGAGLAKPAVLVMPDATGGRGLSPPGPTPGRRARDATHLPHALPRDISPRPHPAPRPP